MRIPNKIVRFHAFSMAAVAFAVQSAFAVLPIDLLKTYTEVEYIESSGSQYIDTGYTPTSLSMGFYLDFVFNSTVGTSNTGTMLGSSVYNNGNWGGLLVASWTSKTRGQLTFGSGFYDPGFKTGVRMQAELKNKRYTTTSAQDPTYQGESYAIDATCADQFYGTIYLCARHTSGASLGLAKAKVYRLKIYDGDSVIHDFIPVVRQADDAVGLVDVVGDLGFKASATSTAFAKGPDVVLPDFLFDPIDTQDYDGTHPCTPHPNVYNGSSELLTEGTDYTLSWSNNTTVGTGYVTATGRAGTDCEGRSATTDFAIRGYHAGSVVATAGTAADASTATPATFVISYDDPAGAKTYPVSVNFSLSGTAVAGTDYEEPESLSVTIPAGEASATVAIKPLYNPSAEGDLTLTLTIEEGPYASGAGAKTENTVVYSSYAWYWDAENKAITDGDWVISTDTVSGGLRVTGVATVGSLGTLVNLREVVGLPNPIVAIGGNAFKGKTALVTLRLPDTIASIGAWAFGNCTKLTGVTPFLPAALTSIGKAAFRSAPVEDDLVLSNPNLTSIPADDNFNGCFQGIKSKNVDLSGSGITSIGNYAFKADSSIETLKLPTTIATFGNWAFGSCTKLAHVEPFLPDSVKTISAGAFRSCPVTNDLIIASKTCTSIPNDDNYNGCFQGNKSKSIDLSASVITTLGSRAFQGNPVETVKLPETLKTISHNVFRECTKLVSVEPFLPDSVTSVGTTAFYKCPIENNLTIANPGFTSIPGEDNYCGVFAGIRSKVIDLSASGITSIGSYAFSVNGGSNAYIEQVRLPETLKTISYRVFTSCTALKTVTPFFPGSLTSIGTHAFVGCPLEGDLVITNGSFTTLPYQNDTWVGLFQASKISTVDLSASGLVSMNRYVFRNCKQLTDVKLPQTLTTIEEEVFSGCTALTNTSFLAYPTTTFRSTVFNSVGPSNLASRIRYPKTNEGWVQRIAGDSTFVAWADAGDKQAVYTELFPDGSVPKGYSTFGNRLLWLVPVSDSAGVVNLSVVAEPEEVGEIDPDYGSYENIGEQLPRLCTNSLFGATATIGYSNVACRVDRMGEDGWELVERCPDTLSYAFDPAEEGTYRLVWEWQPVGYALMVPVSASLGHVVEGGATVAGLSDYGTYYVSNTVVTLEAVATGGTFLRWYGDVPSGHETDNPLQITMECAKTVTPYFESDEWTLSGATLTDGNWTLNTSGSSAALTITSVKAVDSTVVRLNLAKPVAGGGVIKSVSAGAFRNRSQLDTVLLPSTLTSIGDWAFGSCTKLAHVIPFLPDSLTSIGKAAFRSAPVEDDLVLSNPKLTSIPADDNFNGCFQGIKSKNVDLSGSGITSIGNYAFKEDSSIETLKLPTTIATFGNWSFGSCSKLAHVEPFLPDSVTTINGAAFRGCPVTNDLVIASTTCTSLPKDDNYNGVFGGIRSKTVDLSRSVITSIGSYAFTVNGSGNAYLEKIKLPSKLKTIGHNLFMSCTKLKTVEPFLPETVTSIGSMAFYCCPVENDLLLSNPNLTTIPNDNNYCGVFQGIRSPVVDLSKSGVSSVGSWAFRSSPKIVTVKFPPAMAQINGNAFNGCSGLRNLYWHHSTALTLDSTAFSGVSSLQFRHFIPKDEFWTAYLADSAKCTLVTPLTSAEMSAYVEKFPGERKAKGKVKLPTGAAYEYYCTWNPDGGFTLIVR